MKKIVALSFILITIISCNSKKAASGEADFTILKENGYGGRETESHELVNDTKELIALCKELNIKEIPAVNFAQSSVVAVFMGQKRSGGYSITIEKVTVEDNTALVLVKNTVPEPGAAVTMALTAPYCVALIPKADDVEVKENPVKM